MASNNTHHDVRCVFCNEEFETENKFKDHLMMCGNKTDRCPKCLKYIRRAIFAYHYENGCADLDELDGPRQTPRKEERVQKTTTECPFCQQEFNFTDIDRHVTFCEKDSERNTGRSLPVTYTGDDYFDNASTGRQPTPSYNTLTTRIYTQPLSDRIMLTICPWCKRQYSSKFYDEDHKYSCTCRPSNQLKNQRFYLSRPWQCLDCKAMCQTYNYYLEHQERCPYRHRPASSYRSVLNINLGYPYKH